MPDPITVGSLAKTTVDAVLQKVTASALDELAMTLGVRGEVWYIKGELEMMQSFLVVAEDQQNDNILLRTWVRQVADLAYKIEDCLAEFYFHLENRSWCYRLLTLMIRRHIATDIREIKAKVQEVSQRNLRYNLIKPVDVSYNVTSRQLNLTTRIAAHVVEEAELVGHSEQKRHLIQLITGTSSIQPAQNTAPGTSSTQPAQNTEPGTSSTQPAENTEPGTPSTQPAQTTEPGTPSPQPAQSTEPGTSSTQPVENTEPGTASSQPAESTEPGTSSTQPVENTEPGTPSTQPAENTERGTPSTQPTQNTEPRTSSTQPAENTEPGTSSTQPAQNTEPGTSSPQPAQNTDRRRHIILVTGMGGLGKTTLTKKVYDEVRHKFNRVAWVSVSQNFDLTNILFDISKQIKLNNEAEPVKEDNLADYVKLKLQQKYLVVLDDLWTIQAWNAIENVFPGNNDSRVIITTRNIDVVNRGSCEIYALEHLSDEHSYDLLLRKMNIEKKEERSKFFHQPERKYLKDVFDKIIKKCGGLPLALVTIGGLLASKPINKEEWDKVCTRLGSELETNPSAEAVKQILDLSYINLPYYLKPCLLYLSIFPEDYDIKRRTLVYRWIAEGFVKERRGMTLEEVAEAYFCDLINRSLIQPSEVGDEGTIKSCRVHDIMRELIVAKSMDANLIYIAGDGNEQNNMNFRHLVVLPDSRGSVGGGNQPNIRSVSIFDGPVPDLLLPSCLFFPCSESKLLRVLDFKKVGRKSIIYNPPNLDKYHQFIKHVHKFVHLKYIRIQRSGSELRKFFGSFRNLQTFEMMEFKTPEGRLNISNNLQLRHLLIGKPGIRGDPDSREHGGFALDKGIRNNIELQSLDSVDLKMSHPRVIEEVAELQQLKRLGVVNLDKTLLEKFSTTLSKLRLLRYLRIQINSTQAVNGALDNVLTPPEHLRTLKLYGSIAKLPIWFKELYKLTEIALGGTQLEGNAIAVLQELPSLVAVLLSCSFVRGASLLFESTKFPVLKVLKLEGLILDRLVCEKGSLPQCEMLQFGCCDFKNDINGIQYPLKLKKVVIYSDDQNTVANQYEVIKNQLEGHPNGPTIWR